MSAPLTHATVNALRYLRGERDDLGEQWRPACGSSATFGGLLPAVVCRDIIPTCPACAVLRDAALEGREVTT